MMKRNKFILQDENKKTLLQEIKEARHKTTMELLQKTGIRHVQKKGSFLMLLSAEQAKIVLKKKHSK